MPKILAVGNINDDLISLKAIINDAFPGAVVITALDGPKGIELAIATNPDVILLDMILPGMDSFEVCRLLKLDERVNDIPVVFLTALKGDIGNRTKALAVGAEGFLSKPIEQTELIAQIRAMVKIKAAGVQKRDEKQQLENLVEERTKELLRSQAQLKGIFENLQDAYFQADLKGNFTIASPSAVKMYGFESVDELVGQPAEILYSEPQERDFLIAELKSSGQIHDYACQGRKKDGTVFWVSMNVQLLRNNIGQVIGTEGVVRDISERIKVESALNESEEKYRTMVDLLPDAVIIHEGGKFVFANAAALRTVGANSFEQFIERPLMDYVHPDFRDVSMSRIMEIYSTGQPSKFSEEKFLTLNNEIIDVEVIGIPILYMGKPAIQTIIRDITERKRAEKEVQDSYNLLNKLTAQVPGVVYQYRLYPDGRSAFPYSSPGMLDIYEVTSEEVMVDASPVFTRLHPDDYNDIVEAITESARSQTLFHSEFRVILPKQGLRWRMCDAKPEPMDDGSTLWYGIITDITERKLAEQRLKESQQLFQELFNASPDAILLIDPHDSAIPWSILDCNDAACKMNGYTREEMIGQSIDFLHTTAGTSEARDYYLKSLREKGILHTEATHRHKKGYIFPLEVSTSVVNIGGRELVLGIDRDISDRKQAECELREKEVQYRNLANSGVALIWTSGTDKLCNYFNEPWLNFTGRTIEQELGDGWLEGVHPEDLDRCIRTYSSSFDKREPFEMEYRLRHANGEYRWIQDMGTPNFNSEGDFIGYIGHCFDITDHKKLETEITAAKENAEKNEHEIILKNNELISRNKFIQTVLDQLPIGIALNKINDGSATYMNKKFEDIYGWRYDEINSITSFFEQVYPDADYRNELMKQIMNDIQSGDSERMHWKNIFVTRKDGSKRVINAVNIPLVDQNTMVSTVSDITDLHKTQNDLLAAKDKAEESDRLKSAFLANMSHEIRTPLNSIIGFSELLSDPDFNADRKIEFAKTIHSSGSNLLSIISDIMDFSKIEAGQIQVNISRFMVNQLIWDIQKEYAYKASEKGIELRLDPANPTIETFLESDENRIKQVLVNFVGNSIKFTAKGFIEIGFVILEDFIQFHVIDTGIGIPKNFHESIFERFGQVDSSSTRKYGGNGLGLAISKSLVEILGGRIWMESEPEKGSAFYFTIPVKAPAALD